MKKLSIFFAALAMSAMAMAVDTPKKTINFVGPDNFKIGATTKLKVDSTFTDGTDTIKLIADASNGYKYNAYETDTTILFGKKGAALQLSAFDFAVSKIVVYGAPNASGSTGTNIYVGKTAVSTACSGCKNANTFSIDKAYQAAGNIYQIQVTTSANAQVSKIEIYEAVAGAPENPEFSPEGGTYTSAQTVTLTCATDGADIQYSFDGATYMAYSEPLLVESTQTIYAKAVKSELESDVVSATYKIVTVEGDGTKENPYTVADVKTLANPGFKDAWVTGTIVGVYSNNKPVPGGTSTINANMAIATGADTIPVALPTGTVRDGLNLVNNPTNLGRTVKVKGELVAYFSVTGVKNTSDYELSGATKIDAIQENKSAVKKMIINGQIVFLKDGKMFNALGAEL